MRRIVRTVAASFVIILGLALVSVAAFSSESQRQELQPPPEAPEIKAIPPFDPDSGHSKASKVKWRAPDTFASEFGERGDHEVTISIRGNGYYQVQWRGSKEKVLGAGNYSNTSTVNGGFPVAQVAVHGSGPSITCSITVDGVEKDVQTTSHEQAVVFCEA